MLKIPNVLIQLKINQHRRILIIWTYSRIQIWRNWTYPSWIQTWLQSAFRVTHLFYLQKKSCGISQEQNVAFCSNLILIGVFSNHVFTDIHTPPQLRFTLFFCQYQGLGGWTVKSTMMNVSMDIAPIIPLVLTWLPTMSASVLRALLVSYLCHRFHSWTLMNTVQTDDSSAVITIKVYPLSNVSTHSPISEWLQLTDYEELSICSWESWM